MMTKLPILLRRAALLVAATSLASCASAPSYRSGDEGTEPSAVTLVEREPPGCADPAATFECDRRAILAMLGEYRVSFHFNETVALAPGYQPKPDKNSGAYELVLLVEDSGRRIVLQHLLLMPGGGVIKHWRQDWEYETAKHWAFVGDQRFEPRERTPDEIRGTWTQSVYEVHDGPRYAGLGRWNHRYGVATWTSERTWRPLPRREYTTREDYDLLNVENRHTITPTGWTHEQDNSKVERRGARDRTLVREFGFNDYRLVSGQDFGPARLYWEETQAFWAAVRLRWQQRLATSALRLAYPANEETFLGEFLKRAEQYRADGDLAAAEAWLDDRFAAKVIDERAAVSSTNAMPH
jgi:hypothetical protein